MADQPTIAADRARPLPIAEALRDRDCGNVLAVAVSNLPPGAELSAGVDNGDGSWTLVAADLDGLTVMPSTDGFGDVILTISTTTRDPADASAPPTTTAFGLTVAFSQAPDAAAVELPAVAVADVATNAVVDAGNADGERTVALDIDIGLSTDDAPEPISVAIGGVPAGATLSAGADAGDGTWVLDATALAGLALTLPAGAPDQLTLGIAATAADGTSATGVLTLAISELPDAAPETPSPPAIGPEPAFEPVFEAEPEPQFKPEPEPAVTPEFIPDYEPDMTPSPPPSLDIAALPGAHVPVAYWNLDEPLPGTVADRITNHHGRSHGVAESGSDGTFDAVDSFDGIDDYIVVSHTPDLAPAAGTLTVWFNAFAGGQATIVAKGAAAAGAHMALAVAGRRLRFVLGDGAAMHLAEGGAFGAAEWNQATITWGAAGMAMYLNGEPTAADDYAGGLASNDAPWLFGAADTGDGAIGDFFHGELDDIALYAEQFDTATVRRLFQLGVIGLMSDEAAETSEPDAAAGGDSARDLDAIPIEAEGPASLAVLDSETGDDDVDTDAADNAAAVATPDDAVEDVAAGGDSALDLDAIPSEVEGPESLAILDAEESGAEDANVADDITGAETAPAKVGDDDGVFVFGAGGGYFQGGDGWSDRIRLPPGDDAPAVAIAADRELTLTGGDKFEW